jgi:hypothetical protein
MKEVAIFSSFIRLNNIYYNNADNYGENGAEYCSNQDVPEEADFKCLQYKQNKMMNYNREQYK